MKWLVRTINQYYLSEDDSPVHRLDPRTKIFLVIITAGALVFIQNSYLVLTLATGLSIFFAALTRKWIAVIAPLVFCAAGFAMLIGFISIAYSRPAVEICAYVLGGGAAIVLYWTALAFFKGRHAEAALAAAYFVVIAVMTGLAWIQYARLARPDFFAAFYGTNGAEYFLRVTFLRLLPVMTLTFAMVLTTRPSDIIRALRQMRIPQIVLFPTTIMVRFFPTFVSNLSQIYDSLRLRGFSVSFKNVIRRPGLFLRAFLTPLILTSVKAADDLAAAAETRGFHLKARPTAFKKLRFRWSDAAVVLAAAVFAVWAVPTEMNAGKGSGEKEMIRVENLSYTYPSYERSALRSVSFDVEPGECVLLTGESGCGKSTLIRCLNGLIPHFHGGVPSGNVIVNGRDVFEQPVRETGLSVGSVFQDPEVQFFALHVDEEVAFGLEQRGIRQKKMEHIVPRSLSRMGLLELKHRSIFALSGGEKQRVALAAVTSHNPPVLVLDEPSASLDPGGIRSLRELLEMLKAAGHTIIIAEHRLYWLEGLVDRLLVMHSGSLVFDGVSEKLNNPEFRDRMGLRACNLDELFVGQEDKIARGNEYRLAAEDVRYRYGRKLPDVLAGVNLELTGGEVAGLIGPNGCGKSTFARCLCGLLEPTNGRFILNGRVVRGRDRLAECGMVLQRCETQLALPTVRAEVSASQTISAAKKQDDFSVKKIMRQLDVADYADHHPLALSGGQKQRVAVAAAIARGARLLVFDEPTTGMDGKHLREFVALVKGLRRRGVAQLLLTHDFELLAAVCDRVYMLRGGCVKQGEAFETDSGELMNWFAADAVKTA